MTTIEHKTPTPQSRKALLSRPFKTALWMVAAVASFFLVRENWALFSNNWIYLLLLACPLMHFFHGHGGHGGHSNNSNKNEE
ncbi:hypothetical protein LPB72_09820 [Hydrogenophaga crassostreae]|uniref:DUF2933 domain-containing protein n=2 Tax=Hydrogenophaga crassostreae TaxID=1763535 RepID=A0ABX2U609_9BURK|nr:DUF2933 domain-containing protein [Hydrogenophaga crassostreae]OAD41619.1 hypothetical protein LPB72_09820 [Hydrogenophaga crassostreae]